MFPVRHQHDDFERIIPVIGIGASRQIRRHMPARNQVGKDRLRSRIEQRQTPFHPQIDRRVAIRRQSVDLALQLVDLLDLVQPT